MNHDRNGLVSMTGASALAAAGTLSIGDAARMIALDDADVMLAGGAEAAGARAAEERHDDALELVVRVVGAGDEGAIVLVGEAGELEHAAALLHPKLGAPLRAVIGGGRALVPSSKAIGRAGEILDVPLGHKDAAYVRSHFDGMRLRLPDAPRPNEIVVAVALQQTGRPLPRVGGLTHDQFVGEDGLR